MTDEEDIMEFPMAFPIKIMGRDTPTLHVTARSIVEKHAGPVDDDAVNTALSRNERFVSITITITAESREQLDKIYYDLTEHDDVLMAL